MFSLRFSLSILFLFIVFLFFFENFIYFHFHCNKCLAGFLYKSVVLLWLYTHTWRTLYDCWLIKTLLQRTHAEDASSNWTTQHELIQCGDVTSALVVFYDILWGIKNGCPQLNFYRYRERVVMTEILPRVLLKNGKKADHRVMVKESKISFFFSFVLDEIFFGNNMFLRHY